MPNQPKMKFEEIVDKFKGRKYVPASKSLPKEVSEELVDCPECGEQFILKVRGPRSAFGKCRCGLTIIS